MLQGSVVGLGCGWKSCHQFPVVLSVCVFDSPSICFLGLIHHLLRVLSNSCCLPHLFKFIMQVEFILIEDSSQLLLQWRLNFKKKKKSFDVLCLFQNLSSPLDRKGNPEKMRLSVLSVTGLTAQSFLKTLPKPCLMLVTPGGARFAQRCGHAVTCWLLLHLSSLLESSAHLANLPSFYHCDSWILLSLILPSFLLSIYRVWNVRWDNYRMCWCLQTADRASTAGAASCTSRSLPTSSVLWHVTNVSVLSYFIGCVAFPRECRSGLSICDGCHGLDMSALVSGCSSWKHFSVSNLVLGHRRKEWWDLKEGTGRDLSPPCRAEGPAELGVVSTLLPGTGCSSPVPGWWLCSGLWQQWLWAPSKAPPDPTRAPCGRRLFHLLSQTFLLTYFWEDSSGQNTPTNSHRMLGFAHAGKKGAEKTQEWSYMY